MGHYVAVDLAEKSVISAQGRWEEDMKNQWFKPKAIFMVNDVGSSDNPMLKYLDKDIWFDMVSC